jgi:hypothetical protein
MLSTISCRSRIPADVKNAFTYSYTGKYTGLDTLINIKGYYSRQMFYDNGLVFGSIGDYNSKRHKNDEEENISLFLQEVAENTKAKDSNLFYNFINCGTYMLCGDTIKVQIIHKSYSLNDNWSGQEEWYKIIDRNTLQSIRRIPLTTNKKEKEFRLKNYLPKLQSHTFTPILIKPNPDEIWILKEKWFWCNEQDWKIYMEKIKKRKKK